MEIPGVGLMITTATIAYKMNNKRFKNKRKAQGYTVVPRVRETSDKKTSSGNITREGVQILRAYLCPSALSVLNCKKDEAKPLQEWYQNISKVKRKGWKKARVALAR